MTALLIQYLIRSSPQAVFIRAAVRTFSVVSEYLRIRTQQLGLPEKSGEIWDRKKAILRFLLTCKPAPRGSVRRSRNFQAEGDDISEPHQPGRVLTQ